MNIHTVYRSYVFFTFDSDLSKMDSVNQIIRLTKLFGWPNYLVFNRIPNNDKPNINYLPNIIWLNRKFNYSVATLVTIFNQLTLMENSTSSYPWL